MEMEIVSLGIGSRVKIGNKYTCEGKDRQVISIPSADEIVLTEQNDVRETPAEREAWLDRIARDDRHDPPRQSSGVRTVQALQA
jgi:hypothetical protein